MFVEPLARPLPHGVDISHRPASRRAGERIGSTTLTATSVAASAR